jgi:serine/threonine protein kinase/Tol biopolymer transport system component
MTTGPDGSNLTGRRLGVYQVEELIGAGGMGQVYRARDTRLDRDVAIKVLPGELKHDADRVARLEREATLLASLSHPNVAHIYGLEDADGARAIVMEYVRGETLAGRRLSIDDALKVARQIAGALEAAHENGIVHRDLKPANVMITAGGTVKVLDFGLAKLVTGESGSDERALTNSPTMLSRGATRDGVLLGTGAYMSPEQARGQAVDERADIWAFGCVVFEMLAGHAAFAKDTLSDTIAAVLEREPDWQRLPPTTPDNIRRLLRRCLHKDQRRRLADIRDALLELDEAPADVVEAARPSLRARRVERAIWAAALLIVATVAAVLIARPWAAKESPIVRPVRFEIASPPTRDPASIAISPDGRQIVFAATSNDRTKLWRHSIDDGSARPLIGTDGGRLPFWSPDSRSIGFFAQGKLKRLDLESGTILVLTDAPNPEGGAWSDRGEILFSPFAGPLFRIPSTGGTATMIESTTGLGPAESPRILSGTRRVLVSVRGPSQGIYVADLDSPTRQRLADRAVATATEDSLLFIRDRTLLAQRFDPVTLTLTGAPTQIADGVTAASALSNRALVYRSGAVHEPIPIWFDRSGREVGRAREPGTSPWMSRDGRRITMMRTSSPGESGQINPGIWVWDLQQDGFRRIVAAPPVGNTPIWSPDGTRIVFSSARNGRPFALYEKAADESGGERLFLQTDQSVFANDWSLDGTLIYRTNSAKGGFDLWTLSVKDGRRQPLVETQFNEREAQFSPDGRWFAFQSDESGQYEIYLRPFPDDGRKGYGPVSVNGGTQVRWNPNGKELFYLGLDDRLMSVTITTTASGRSIEAAKPISLFQTHIIEAGVLSQQYVVSHEGNRLLVLTTQEAIAPITVILNWQPGGGS